ncbi:COG1361 S-layer family protein [Salinilacihabitans rarus]|uniref:COG1361 S-layer family protein n=1 Tax=Salinilacihabitans rarus TaxID=2961596 RepID=UPI0020C864F6|nr:hypothetical protein [Salinilacihabitans rarus]
MWLPAGADSRRGRGRPRRRATVVALSLVLVLVLALATPAAIPSATARQDDRPENETAANGTPDVPADGPAPDGFDGREATEPPLYDPEDDPEIEVDLEEGTVPAEGVGTLTFEVDNEAGETVTDVVVTLRSYDPALFFGPPSRPQGAHSFYLDELLTADSETVAVEVGSTRTEPGTYPLYASVQYAVEIEAADPDEREVRTVGPAVIGVDVAEDRRFGATNVTASVPVDAEATYEVRVTNEGNETATDVVAAVDVGPPLSAPSPTAYVGTLGPGESETVRFGLESSEDAIETTDSVAVTLAYDDEAGERTSSDPIQVPVRIVEEEDETDVESVAPFAAAAAVLALVAVWWWRRR